jgi:hypothetical protein
VKNKQSSLPKETSQLIELIVDKGERRKEEDKKLDQLVTIKDILTFLKKSKNKRSIQYKLKEKDPAVAGMEYIFDLE